MPKVFKRGGSRFYCYRLYVDGKDCWFSTKSTNKAESQRIADEHNRAIKAGISLSSLFELVTSRIYMLPEDEQHKKRVALANMLLRNSDKSLLLDEVWEAWLERSGDQAERTLKDYKSICSKFVAWAIKKDVLTLNEVTRDYAEDYLNQVWKSGVTPRTYNGHLKFLKQLCKTLSNRAGLLENPFEGIGTKKQATAHRENFSVAELQLIAAHADGEMQLMVAVGVYTGLRLYDAVHLRWSDIESDRIKIVPQKTRRSGKKITIMLHPVLRRMLDAWRRVSTGTEYLFPDAAERYAKDSTSISKDFGRLLKSLGIETTAKEIEGRRARRAAVKGFHSLRHSFVSLCAASNVPQTVTQAMVGHGSPAMTEIYTHTTPEQKQKAVDMLPELFGDTNSGQTIDVAAVEKTAPIKKKRKRG